LGGYPILYLNFAEVKKSISIYIVIQVCSLGKKHGLECDEGSQDDAVVIQEMFPAIKRKAEKRLVILVDEYDLPVMRQYFAGKSSSNPFEVEIQAFFSSLKRNSHHIDFMFIFGATRVTTVGGTDNLLNDLTLKEGIQ